MYGFTFRVTKITAPVGLKNAFIKRAIELEKSLFDFDMTEEWRAILVKDIKTLYHNFTTNISITEDETLGNYEEEIPVYELKTRFIPKKLTHGQVLYARTDSSF